jgi:hypothetical protein
MRHAIVRSSGFGLCVAVLCGFGLGTSSRAQAPQRLEEAPGRWIYAPEPASLRPYALDAAGTQAALATWQRLNDIFRAAPVMNPPRGLDARAVGRALDDRQSCPTGCAGAPVVSNLWALLSYFVEGPGGKPITGVELNVALDAFTNSPATVMTEQDRLGYEAPTDADGRAMFREPRRTRTIGGHAMYNERLVVVTRSPRPLFLPVSRDSFLRASLRDARTQLTETGMPDSDLARGLRDRLRRVQAELDALTPTARASQAWFLEPESPLESGLAEANTPDARPLVVVNPDFLDRTAPRSAVQIVTIRLNWGTYFDETTRSLDTIGDDDHVSVRRLWQLLNQADWTKISALLR